MEKHNIAVPVYYGSDESPVNLGKFIKWVSSLYDQIPAEYRNAARIDFMADDYGVDIDISYLRPETDAELADRTALVARNAAEAEARERAYFERLKILFGEKDVPSDSP